jgi:hypothetical protein
MCVLVVRADMTGREKAVTHAGDNDVDGFDGCSDL